MATGQTWHTPARGSHGWYVVVGASFLALVDDQADYSVIDSLWRHVAEESVPIENLVSLIPLDSESGVHSIALVSLAAPGAPNLTERTITAVVRGTAAIDIYSIGGSRRFGSGGVQPWVLADFRSVTALMLGGDYETTAKAPHRDRRALPIQIGAVHAQRVVWALAADDVFVDSRRAAENSVVEFSNQPAGFQYRLNDAAPIDLLSKTMFGRKPRPAESERGPVPALVKVNSPEQAVSSTHVSLEQQSNAVIVTDLQSTNGTVIRVPGHEPLRIRPGEALAVGQGTTIDIGDSNIIEIMLCEPGAASDAPESNSAKGSE